jgi:hypothetical protein
VEVHFTATLAWLVGVRGEKKLETIRKVCLPCLLPMAQQLKGKSISSGLRLNGRAYLWVLMHQRLVTSESRMADTKTNQHTKLIHASIASPTRTAPLFSPCPSPTPD